MREVVLELADGAGEIMWVRCAADGTMLGGTKLHSLMADSLVPWEPKPRQNWLGSPSLRHLVPVIDAAFAALKGGTDAQP